MTKRAFKTRGMGEVAHFHERVNEMPHKYENCATVQNTNLAEFEIIVDKIS